jgi:hypothetical protein
MPNKKTKIIFSLFFFFAVSSCFCKVDSVQIFYEKNNSILSFSLEDYKTELRSVLASKSEAYLQSFEELVANCKESVLYLRNDFWSARSCYSRSDYPALEEAGFILFKTGMARISQGGKYYSFDNCQVTTRPFYVCNKKENALAGTELWLISSSTRSLLLSIPKTVTKEFLEKAWCE